MRLVSVLLSKTNELLNNNSIYRSDTEPLMITVVEPNQTGASLRMVFRRKEDYPHGAIQILKSGTDFQVQVTEAGNTLTAQTTISKLDTRIFLDRAVLLYDLERIIDEGLPSEDVTTLERGMLTILPDLATN